MNEMKIQEGVKIDLYKTIPVSSGLGGGSTDAAAVLRGLNFMFKKGLTYAELEKMSEKIGSDVPFCIKGGTQRVTGRGEVLKTLKPFSDVWFVILKPKETVDTSWAYKEYDKAKDVVRPDMDLIQGLMEKRDLRVLDGKIINIFEKVVLPYRKTIETAKEELKATGAGSVFMTGSGSAVAAMYYEMKDASMAYTLLSKKYSDLFITKTSGGLL
jgi:4-diphosphocytidyl-2-C-methyl-D-erythritol kinase